MNDELNFERLDDRELIELQIELSLERNRLINEKRKVSSKKSEIYCNIIETLGDLLYFLEEYRITKLSKVKDEPL